MKLLYSHHLNHLDGIDIKAQTAEITDWQGYRALKLDGFVWVRDLKLQNAIIDVRIGVDEHAYPGILFRGEKDGFHELAYAQPHTSGQWDALQYDPNFNGSNTWQIHHGKRYQQTALIPKKEWFPLRVKFHGNIAEISTGDQPPLVVYPLAHSSVGGAIGLWSYLPAYFTDLQVYQFTGPIPPRPAQASLPKEILLSWNDESGQPLICDPNGILNLNRRFPLSTGKMCLSRQFETMCEGTIQLSFGYSDELEMYVDRKLIFEGSNTFKGFGNYVDRGYVDLESNQIEIALQAGVHRLEANLAVCEPFGWGIQLAASGCGLRWIAI